MYNDIYRSAAEDIMREMRKRATEHRLYVNAKKAKKSSFPKRLFGSGKGA